MSHLNLKEAQESPCSACSAPCCGSLPLHSFTISNYTELDYARYLLNFSGIELVFLYGKTWQVQLSRDCSRLKEGLCTLHGTDAKPRICRKYSAYSCLYKPIFFQEKNVDFVRFNRERFEIWASYLVFDPERKIIGQPEIPDLLAVLPPFKAEPSLPIPEMGAKRESKRLGYFEFQKPCHTCPAWCCKTLSFPFEGIHSRSNLDYLWFVLGFSGVELGIADQGWTIVVQAQCLNYGPTENGYGCTVFGKKERPMQCEDYDETICAYKSHYGLEKETPVQLRVGQDNFEQLAGLYVFTEAGEIIEHPSFPQMATVL